MHATVSLFFFAASRANQAGPAMLFPWTIPLHSLLCGLLMLCGEVPCDVTIFWFFWTEGSSVQLFFCPVLPVDLFWLDEVAAVDFFFWGSETEVDLF